MNENLMNQAGTQAAEIDSQASAAQGTPQKAQSEIPAVANVSLGSLCVTGIKSVFQGIVSKMFPRVAPIWNDSTCEITGNLTGAVLEKHGVSLGENAPEIALALVLIPAVIGTVLIIWHDLQEIKKQASADKPAAMQQAAPAAARVDHVTGAVEPAAAV